MTRGPIDEIMLMDELIEHVQNAARLFKEKRYKEAIETLDMAMLAKEQLEEDTDD